MCSLYLHLIIPLKYMSSYTQVHGLSVVSALVNKVCLICCTLKAMLYILIINNCY